jgi:hypothetical protein
MELHVLNGKKEQTYQTIFNYFTDFLRQPSNNINVFKQPMIPPHPYPKKQQNTPTRTNMCPRCGGKICSLVIRVQIPLNSLTEALISGHASLAIPTLSQLNI